MRTKYYSEIGCESEAIYSDCETYRYELTRVWDEKGKRITFVMLNPSTATEVKNDPTVERCEQRARKLGYGAFRVVNIFAYRATDPKDMRSHAEPVGEANDQAILDSCDWADAVICAWGTHGAHLDRHDRVKALLESKKAKPMHLGLSKAGFPKHPLYIGYDKQPEPWDLAA